MITKEMFSRFERMNDATMIFEEMIQQIWANKKMSVVFLKK